MSRTKLKVWENGNIGIRIFGTDHDLINDVIETLPSTQLSTKRSSLSTCLCIVEALEIVAEVSRESTLDVSTRFSVADLSQHRLLVLIGSCLLSLAWPDVRLNSLKSIMLYSLLF
jgi:hypothetical protein